MSLIREAGVSQIVQFAVPYNGTWNSVAANMLSPDTLYHSMNIYVRRGKVRARPGLLQQNSSVLSYPVQGGAMAVTPTDKVLLAVTGTELYTLKQSDSVWQSDTVATFTTGSNPIDITFLETMSTYVAVLASPGFGLKAWIQESGVAPIFGSPPAKSVCTAARRIVALVEPHTIQWSTILDYTTWPALAIAKVAQTNDVGICVRSLGTLTFVIYKERSIYIARAQAGSDANGFNIQFVQMVEGPAGVHSVVDVLGTHWYMTKNGRVGIFDGTAQVQWVADGLWLYLQDDIDPVQAYRIFGVFDYRLHTVTFYYPRISDVAGQMTGMLIINIPLAGSNIQIPAAFLGMSMLPCTYGMEMRFDDRIDRSVVFSYSGSTGRPFLVDESTQSDDGTPYQCVMQTGLYPLPETRVQQCSVESFFEKQDGYGAVNLYSVTSDALETDTGDIRYSNGALLDLNNRLVSEYVGFNTPTRFFGLRYEWLSTNTVRYGGAIIYGRTVV